VVSPSVSSTGTGTGTPRSPPMPSPSHHHAYQLSAAAERHRAAQARLPPWAGRLAVRLLLNAVTNGWPVTCAALAGAMYDLGVSWAEVEAAAIDTGE
jgi:hypothetical protein